MSVSIEEPSPTRSSRRRDEENSSDDIIMNNHMKELYETKSASKVVRVLTVLAYLLSVSFAAILLSVYYIFVWDPPRPPGPTMESLREHNSSRNWIGLSALIVTDLPESTPHSAINATSTVETLTTAAYMDTSTTTNITEESEPTHTYNEDDVNNNNDEDDINNNNNNTDNTTATTVSTRKKRRREDPE